jgi:hypothetical protein
MSSMVSYEPLVDSTTRVFLSQTERLFSDTGAVCNFSRWLQFYAFDVIGEITWSKRLGFVEKNEDVDGVVEFLGKFLAYCAPVSWRACSEDNHVVNGILISVSDRPNALP